MDKGELTMTTYYYFTCTKCGTRGGSLGSQAWGWGNFDMVESFKFLAYHINKCGEDSIRIISEDFDHYVDLLHDEYNVFLEETKHIFPHSRDWDFLVRSHQLSLEELKQKWVDEQAIKEQDERIKITGQIQEIEIMKEGPGHYVYLGQVVCPGGEVSKVLAHTRELPQLNQSYMIMGVRQNHPELGEILEVHKLLSYSESSA
jgi:hypothetical protein